MHAHTGFSKTYSGEFRLGEATATLDTESPVSEHMSWEHVSDVALGEAARAFLGE